MVLYLIFVYFCVMEKYYVYLTENIRTGDRYVGMHKVNKFAIDTYLGSGTLITPQIIRYGEDNFHKIILKYCNSKRKAFALEKFFVFKYNTIYPWGLNVSFSKYKNELHSNNKYKKLKYVTIKEQQIQIWEQTYDIILDNIIKYISMQMHTIITFILSCVSSRNNKFLFEALINNISNFLIDKYMKKNIHLQLDSDLYVALKNLKNKANPTIAFMIREAVIEYLRNKTITVSMSPVIRETEEIPRGIQVPKATPIKNNDLISVPVGFTPRDLIIAQRAKKRGRPYDKSLEPFLDGNTKD